MAEYRTITVGATVTDNGARAAASVSDMAFTVGATISTSVAYSPLPHYGGTYEVTPSAEAQTLATAGEVMDGDVVIRPIPSNYGLITWDGSTLTVS